MALTINAVFQSDGSFPISSDCLNITSLQLLEVLDKWTEALDNGHCVDCIYMDFQKAFDKVPHKKLLEKIKSYGIPVVGPTLNWIEDFLKNFLRFYFC
jgi:hypothetical protein